MMSGSPSVIVVGPREQAQRLVSILAADGLEATVAGRTTAPSTAEVVVVVVESAAGSQTARGRARDRHPEARVVLVLPEATPAEARQLLVEDVPALVLQRDLEVALAPAIRAVVAGQTSYPAELMPTQLRTALSTREKQILAMVVMGFSNAEIAAKLYLTESTVKSHLYSAFGTLGVSTRKEAIALILDPNAGFGAGILRITDADP